MKHLYDQSYCCRKFLIAARSWSKRPSDRRSRLEAILLRALASIAALIAISMKVSAAEPAAAASSNAPIWAATIGGVVSVLTVCLTLFVNARGAAKEAGIATEQRKTAAEAEQKQRQRELALKIVEMIAVDGAAKRRFAIGLLKVEDIDGTDEQKAKSNFIGQVHFIPVNSRVTAGRSSKNDIVISDPALDDEEDNPNLGLSRFQCGFVADQDTVVLEDFASANGTLVSDLRGKESRKIMMEDGEGEKEIHFSRCRHRTLTDGDRIWIGPFVLRFVKLQKNEVLSH